MSVGGKRQHGGTIIGSCYACGGPCTRKNSTRVKDETVGVRRLVHRGECEARFGRFGPPKGEVRGLNHPFPFPRVLGGPDTAEGELSLVVKFGGLTLTLEGPTDERGLTTVLDALGQLDTIKRSRLTT